MINIKRQALLEKLQYAKVSRPIDLELDTKELRELLLDKIETENIEYYEINPEMKSILSKIDLSNMTFDNVNVVSMDFSKLKGIKINPRMVCLRDLSNCNCSGVEFIGNDGINLVDIFEDVAIDGTIFDGSRGAIINPQTIHKKNLEYTSCGDVTFLDIYGHIPQEELFYDVKIYKTNFAGSKGAIINPQTLFSYEMGRCTFKDVEFIGPFDNATINGSSFKGSRGAEIDINRLGWTNSTIYDINFRDAKVIGDLATVNWAFNIKTLGSKMNIAQQSKLLSKRLNYILGK